MGNPRDTRLRNDYTKLLALEAANPLVRMESTSGSPPDLYIVQLACRSIIKLDDEGQPVYGNFHRLGIHLHADYPRKSPQVSMLTQIFNPNIYESGFVDIGDVGDYGGAPAMGLDDLVERVIKILQYEPRVVNPVSASNVVAAIWMRRQDLNMFPLKPEHFQGTANLLNAIEILDDDFDLEV